MTATELAPYQGQGALALRGDQTDWTETQSAALAQIGIDEAPRGDQLVLMHVAQRSGLDPFARQIYLIGRWDAAAKKKKWTIQTGIDGFRVIAERRGEYGGQTEPQWCGPDGQWTDVWLSDEPPVAARVGIVRKDWDKPAWGVVKFAEFAGKKSDGSLTSMWLTKGSFMISKCAEAAGFRKAFPQDFAGLYVNEETEHLNNPVPAQRVVIESERERPAEPDWGALITEHEAARDVGKLWDLRKLAQGMRPNDGPLLNRIAEAWQRTKATLAAADAATQKPNTSQMNRLFSLLGDAGVKTDDARHRLAVHVLERDDVTTFKDLSAGDVSQLITRLEQLKAEGRLGAARADTTEPPAERHAPGGHLDSDPLTPRAPEGDQP